LAGQELAGTQEVFFVLDWCQINHDAGREVLGILTPFGQVYLSSLYINMIKLESRQASVLDEAALSERSEGVAVDLVGPLSQSSRYDGVEQRVRGTWIDTFKVPCSGGILLGNDGSNFGNGKQLFSER
jgi:hypothetical protein